MALDAVQGDFKLDPSKDPKQIDFTLRTSPGAEQKGKSSLGIYKLDGDKLTFHAAHPGGASGRPTSRARRGQDSMVLTLERVKK